MTMPQLLLVNQIQQDPSSIDYRTQLEALKNAFRQGRKVRVYMWLATDNTEYFSEIVACRMMQDRISAVLPLRPFINGDAELTRANGFFGGSIDTLGTYRWSDYLFGTENAEKSVNDNSFFCHEEKNFVIKWYAD